MNTVSFSAMKDGTEADYRMLDELEKAHINGLRERILKALSGLNQSLDGYKIDRLQHSLQSATRAEADGEDIEWIVAALIHDIGDELAPLNHSQFAASLIRPYVRAEVTWVIEMHGLFQRVYYAHHLGQDRPHRDPWRPAKPTSQRRLDGQSTEQRHHARQRQHRRQRRSGDCLHQANPTGHSGI